MNSKFSKEEKKKYMFKKYIKDHLFEYIVDIVIAVIFTLILLYACRAENYIFGIILTIIYSMGKITYDLIHYKKEYIDIDIKE